MTAPFVIHHGECLEVLRTLPDCSIDSIVTDPPYGLSDHKPAEVIACLTAWLAGEPYLPKGKGFMGKTWDAWVPGPEVFRECLRVLKPGGHMLAFAGTRSMDLMSMAIRLAGFELRDSIGYAHDDDGGAPLLAWTYGSGFPKSLDVSKAIDKEAGAERVVIGESSTRLQLQEHKEQSHGGWNGADRTSGGGVPITAPSTDAARQWEGWGTALKPALEPILLARRPLEGTVAANVLAHGTGALNIDGCRVHASAEDVTIQRARSGGIMGAEIENEVYGKGWARQPAGNDAGRWPANVIHDGSDAVLAEFPQTSSGVMKAGTVRAAQDRPGSVCYGTYGGNAAESDTYGDKGSAARFFYCAKASRTDRNEGCEEVATWESVDQSRVMAAFAELSRAMSEFTMQPLGDIEWSMFWSGSGTKVRFQTAIRYIIETASRTTIASKTLNFSLPLSISESIRVAIEIAKESGSNLAELVEFTSQWSPATTDDAMAFLRHAVHAVLLALFETSKDAKFGNVHSTVKPTDLMRYLCRLITPPGGTVLDPFFGSGSTGKGAILEGFSVVGIERDADSVATAQARCEHAVATVLAAKIEAEDATRQAVLL